MFILPVGTVILTVHIVVLVEVVVSRALFCRLNRSNNQVQTVTGYVRTTILPSSYFGHKCRDNIKPLFFNTFEQRTF